MNNLNVAIIVRTKNRPKQLGEALASINNAHIPNLEVVVVNDGGMDVQPVVTAASANGTSYAYLSLETSQGRSEAGNLGAEASQAPYIFFLDDDDLLAPDFPALLKRFDEHHGPQDNLVLYGKVEAFHCNPDGSKGETYRFFGKDFNPIALLWENYIPFNAAIIPRDLFLQVGGLDSQLKVFEDWDLFLKLSEKAKIVYHPILVAYYRLFENAFILGGSAKLQSDCRIKILEKHWEKYTPQSLSGIYDLVKRDLHHEFLPEAARLEAERERWSKMDLARKTFIDELTNQISRKDVYIAELTKEIERKGNHIAELAKVIERKRNHIAELAKEIERKGNYIDELAVEINRKGKYIETLEHERIEWHSMDSERLIFVQGLQQKIKDLKNMLPKANQNP